MAFLFRKSPSLVETNCYISNALPIDQERHGFVSLKTDPKILYTETSQVWFAVLTIQKVKAGRFLEIRARADYLVSSRPTSALNKALSQNICIYVYMKSTGCIHSAASLAQEKRWYEISCKRKCK